MLLYLSQDNNDDNNKTLVDIYGQKILDVDWTHYYGYAVCCSKHLDLLDLPLYKMQNVVDHFDIKDAKVLYVTHTTEVDDPSNSAELKKDHFIKLPDHWIVYHYGIFWYTGEEYDIELEDEFKVEVEHIDGKKVYKPRSTYLDTIVRDLEDPDEEDIILASKNLGLDTGHHNFATL